MHRRLMHSSLFGWNPASVTLTILLALLFLVFLFLFLTLTAPSLQAGGMFRDCQSGPDTLVLIAG